MRIAVNTRLLRKDRLDGIGWFEYNTLKWICKLHPDTEFHFLFDSGIHKEFLFAENVVGHNLFPPAKHAALNIIWSEFSVRRKLNYLKPDLYFSPDGMLCLGWKGKQHGVIHDINFMHYPEHLKSSNRSYYRYFFPKFAQKAARIATVSQYSKNDIVNEFGLSGSKIDVVYCGINSFFMPLSNNQKEETRLKYSDGKEYFLFVGTLSPRKNIIGLLTAFEDYKKRTGSDKKILIVGGEMYKAEEFHRFHKEMYYKEDVLFAGRLDNEKLNAVYNAAFCLVFIPFFEGFGIPMIEAMKCEIPIIASNVTSLPEVAGDAALLVSPDNTTQIADAMIKVSHDNDLRLQLINSGKLRAEMFSWEKTASMIWDSIGKALYA